jgi:hypothetical protein
MESKGKREQGELQEQEEDDKKALALRPQRVRRGDKIAANENGYEDRSREENKKEIRG